MAQGLSFQPNKRRRKKTHGFRNRLKRTLKRRRKKGRYKLIP